MPSTLKCSSLMNRFACRFTSAKNYCAGQKMIAVLREHRVVPHSIIHAQAYEPAKQKFVICWSSRSNQTLEHLIWFKGR